MGVRIWLDDERDPRDQFVVDNFHSRGDEIWVKTVEEGIALIQSENVESISFDNDLGIGFTEGYKLAQWIEEESAHGRISRMSWNAHTQNPIARKEICQAMTNAEKFWNRQENSTNL